jgi:hypothetical protein
MSKELRLVAVGATAAAAVALLATWMARAEKKRETSASAASVAKASANAPPDSNDAIRRKWEAFSTGYDEHFRLWSLPALHSMISCLELRSAGSCLEVSGVGRRAS